jgi:hypothetical protein
MNATEFELLGELEDELEQEATELELLFPSRPGRYWRSTPHKFDGGSETAAVKRAVANGQRDENALTNLIFFARHPERQGRKLQRSERGFALLSREWIDIRNRVVRPLLAAAGVPLCMPAEVPDLVRLLNLHRGDIPLQFLLGWIQHESGRKICSGTSLDERGYFQIHPGESQSLHLDHKRLSTSPEYSIIGGIKLVQSKMKTVQGRGFTPGTDLFWHLVKLLHWLPKGVDVALAHMRQHGFRASSWDEFRNYMLSNRMEIMRRLGLDPNKCERDSNCGWNPKVGVSNVEQTFAKGRALLAAVASS